MKPLIYAASEGPLSRAQAKEAFEILFNGEATPAQMGGFLMALRARGEAVSEYAAAAEVMRAKCAAVRAPEGRHGHRRHRRRRHGHAEHLDRHRLCGGRRRRAGRQTRQPNLSSKSGAADVQGAMGIDVMVGPEVVEKALAEVGIGFMMAPMHHPAMRHVRPSGPSLGCKTIFNILGPLTNPAGVKRQLTGAFAIDLIFPMAETLKDLGSEAAWLVHGADGTDEISICGTTSAAILKDGEITSQRNPPRRCRAAGTSVQRHSWWFARRQRESLRALFWTAHSVPTATPC